MIFVPRFLPKNLSSDHRLNFQRLVTVTANQAVQKTQDPHPEKQNSKHSNPLVVNLNSNLSSGVRFFIVKNTINQ
jgi:hypothetical protein